MGGKGHIPFGTTLDQGREIEKSGWPIEGDRLMSGRRIRGIVGHMPRYLLHHHHEPNECGVAFTAFRGFLSPLRHKGALASCHSGGHSMWWTVDASSEAHALAHLPYFVAERTTAVPVNEVLIP
jgi:hypothetical protein